MDNIAIIGGSGFIGSYTKNELIDHGYNVTTIDINKNSDICCNVLDYNSLKKALSAKKYDVVYMFAAISDSKENHTDVKHAVNTNIMTLTNTLDAMYELNISRIIFSSTVWVYSVCDSIEVNEDSNLSITNSEHIYTTCKLTCEAIIRNYQKVKNINFTILRYGIAYGPGCHPDTVMSKFINNAIDGKPLIVTGDGSIYRNFLYVTDHARGNRLALSDKGKNQIFNLEGPQSISIKNVAERVQELYGKNAKIIYTGERLGDYKGKIVCNLKAKQLLGWEPKVNFLKGSKLLYNYIKNES
jgi:nucleoside-diphosphate-sugar epimerase